MDLVHIFMDPVHGGGSMFCTFPFVLDIFRRGEREVVETVCLVILPLISSKKDQVSSLNEKGVKAVVLGPGSSDTEIKDAF